MPISRARWVCDAAVVASQREDQGRESGNVHFHNCSTSNETENVVKLLSERRILSLYSFPI